MLQLQHPADLLEAYLTAYGCGAWFGAAGILRDVLQATAERESLPLRCLLAKIIGDRADMDALIDQFRDGASIPTEDLIPLLCPPHASSEAQRKRNSERHECLLPPSDAAPAA